MCNQALPTLRRFAGAAILLGRKPEIKLRPRIGFVEHQSPLKRAPGVRRDDAAASASERLAETGLTIRTFTFEPERAAVGANGIVKAAEPHIHRCDHLPASAIVGAALKMRLDARDQTRDGVGVRNRSEAPRERLSGQIG